MSLLLVTILPSILIVGFIVSADKFKEPTSAIIKVFSYGILITIPAFFINTYLGNFFSTFGINENIHSLTHQVNYSNM